MSTEPSKFLVNKDGSLTEMPGHTVMVKVGGGFPLPSEIETTIIWVLAREWDGFFFTFTTINEVDGTNTPIRVLKARCWFQKGYGVTEKTKVVLRMTELVKMGLSFLSGGSFLANVCNRDMKSEMIYQETKSETEYSTETWVGKGGD